MPPNRDNGITSFSTIPPNENPKRHNYAISSHSLIKSRRAWIT